MPRASPLKFATWKKVNCWRRTLFRSTDSDCMAELEIHHEGHIADPMGQKVGVLAAVLAVGLAVVTINSHRTHTEAIIRKSESNDEWQHYQSSRLKYHNLELGERLTQAL